MNNSLNGTCACGAAGVTMMYEGFVKTGRQLWYCNEHAPDFRAMRLAYFDANGRWPPNPLDDPNVFKIEHQ
jgi:hypothetical protein